MTPANAGFDNQFDEDLRAVVKEASLQPRLAEDLHGSEDVRTLLSREAFERSAIYYRLQAIESRLKPLERTIMPRIAGSQTDP
jgi:hypothetical protein